MIDRATIVRNVRPDWLGRRYVGSVVNGTITSYYPTTLHRVRAWTATGAKRAGDRHIRADARRYANERKRGSAARRATGYTTEERASDGKA